MWLIVRKIQYGDDADHWIRTLMSRPVADWSASVGIYAHSAITALGSLGTAVGWLHLAFKWHLAWVPAEFSPPTTFDVGKFALALLRWGRTMPEPELFVPIKLSGRALYDDGQMINSNEINDITKERLDWIRFQQTWLLLESWDVLILPSSLFKTSTAHTFWKRNRETRSRHLSIKNMFLPSFIR